MTAPVRIQIDERRRDVPREHVPLRHGVTIGVEALHHHHDAEDHEDVPLRQPLLDHGPLRRRAERVKGDEQDGDDEEAGEVTESRS